MDDDRLIKGLNFALLFVHEVDRLIKSKHNGTDLYRQVVANVLHIPIESVTDEQRQLVKEISFGSRHGRGMYCR